MGSLSVQLTSLAVVDSNGQQASFLFTNAGAACSMRGYPTVVLLGNAKTALPNSVNYDDFSTPARQILLQGDGGQASFVAQWVSGSCVRPPTVAAYLGITPPGGAGRLVIPAASNGMRVTVCEGLGIEPVS
ncbi:MAG: DUF4232 domain-containing protein [Mycobacteriales bacterium]